ncbi:MAG: hypothetical protein MUC92_02800 [Fimbriimonadaceae bacterium]|jgi:hypothetical protein|nr:hypothetical protein [Fimbriimonadaceae bacterium]
MSFERPGLFNVKATPQKNWTIEGVANGQQELFAPDGTVYHLLQGFRIELRNEEGIEPLIISPAGEEFSIEDYKLLLDRVDRS